MTVIERELNKIHPQMKFRGWEVRFICRWVYRLGLNQGLNCKMGNKERVEQLLKIKAEKIIQDKINKN